MWTGLIPANFSTDVASNTIAFFAPFSGITSMIVGITLGMAVIGLLISLIMGHHK
jgi:hypothetical protein